MTERRVRNSIKQIVPAGRKWDADMIRKYFTTFSRGWTLGCSRSELSAGRQDGV